MEWVGHYDHRREVRDRAPANLTELRQRLRVAVYTDYAYTRDGAAVYAERAFALFLARLAGRLDGMVIVGRLRPGAERARYRLPDSVRFVGLPYYESLARPMRASGTMMRSLRGFWGALDGVDVCWLLGPHPLAFAFAAIARLRGRRVCLGVRQDTVEYVRSRHPGRRSFSVAARLLDAGYRLLARRCPTVVVGPALRRQYAGSPQLLEIAVSLVERADVVAAQRALARPYDGELTMLSVGRVEQEKNPLMLADVLARLSAQDDRWRLVVCGEGELEAALRARLEELGVAERAELRGYVQHGQDMRDAYRSSHILLHVSLTEGLPQVVVEAFAAGLPVVASDVGGIGEAVGEAAILVPSDDVEAAVEAARRVADDAGARARLVEAGVSYALAHTIDAEVARVAGLLAGGPLDGGR